MNNVIRRNAQAWCEAFLKEHAGHPDLADILRQRARHEREAVSYTPGQAASRIETAQILDRMADDAEKEGASA